MGEFRNVCNFIIIKGAGTYPWVSGLGRGTPGGESGIWRLAHSLTQAYLGVKGLNGRIYGLKEQLKKYINKFFFLFLWEM